MVFGRLANTNLPLPNVASQTVERVTTYKLLGVSLHIDSTLSWSTHIGHIIKKATTRLYFLKQLKRAGLPNSHLVHFYITVIRPVLEFRAPVWHNALTKAQSESLESLQKARYPYYPQPNPRNDVFHPCCFTQMWFRWLHGVFFRDIMDPASSIHSLISPPRSTAISQGSNFLKFIPKSILIQSDTVSACNIVLTTTMNGHMFMFMRKEVGPFVQSAVVFHVFMF